MANVVKSTVGRLLRGINIPERLRQIQQMLTEQEASLSALNEKLSRLSDEVAGLEPRPERYSQEGEDLIIHDLISRDFLPKIGRYVDVGAFHPVRFSNTFSLYKRGWSGINIEPNPAAKAKFEKHRDRDETLTLGVGTEEGSLTYYSFNEPALNTFNGERARKIAQDDNSYEIIDQQSVAVVPLARILDKHLEGSQPIDVMNVDAEGLDLDVLKSNDWEKYRPKCLLCELPPVGNIKGTDEHSSSPFLKSKGYELIARTVRTGFFVSDEAWSKLKT